MPEDADDCGGGRHCNAGTRCWKAPADVHDIRRGELACPTDEQLARYERLIAREKDDEDKRKRHAEQEAAEAKKKKEAEKVAAAQKKVSDQLRVTFEQERSAELKKAEQQKLAQINASMRWSCNQLRLEAIARGENPATAPGHIACAAYGFPWGPVATSAPKALPTTSYPSGSLGAATRSPNVSGIVSQDQLEYLRSNAATLQPEQRKISVPQKSPSFESFSAQSTFMCGSPPNQYLCPSTIEARRKTSEVYSTLGIKPDQIPDRLEERHQKGLEYLRDSPEVREALFSLQAKAAGRALGVPDSVVDAGLLAKSFHEGAADFAQGKHYEATLRAVNEVSSLAAEKLKLPRGSPDVLNLAGAASTAYLYGFFKGL